MRIPRPRNCPVKGGYRCTDLQNRGGRKSVTGRVSRDGTSDAVASSARTCVEARQPAARRRHETIQPAARPSTVRGDAQSMRRRRIRLLHELFQIGLLESAEYNVQQRWGTERLDRRSRRRQAEGALRDRVPSVGKAELAGKAEYISEQARSGRNQLEATKRRKPQS